MRCLPDIRQDRLVRGFMLVCWAAHALSCAPSAFDKFTGGTTEDPATCEGPRCQDGGPMGHDADADQDAEQDADGAEQDADAEPSPGPVDSASEAALDATSQDAPSAAPSDAAGSDGQDAPLDAPSGALDTGPCDGSQPVCQPNQVEPDMKVCGLCDSGVRRRSRTCAANGCSWGAWSEWTECQGEHVECNPSTPAETKMVACTTCGERAQSRSCLPATCTWEPWKDVSACSWCNECSEVVYCDTPSDIANRGTWCRQKACSGPQALANCMEDAQKVCGGIVQPFFMEYL